MGWLAVRDTVQQAIVLASGLDAGHVVWKYQDADEPTLSYIAISLTNARNVGQDFVTTSTDLTRPAGQEVALSTRGTREVGLELECFTAATVDDSDAFATLEKVKSSLLLPSIRNLLASVGFVPFDPGPVADLPEIVAVGFRGRSTCTIRCYVPAQVAVEYAGFIASVSGTITSSGGGVPGEVVEPFSAP